jgi:DNA-binding NarL/FixJ family response regulator
VLIVQDHPLLASALATILRAETGIDVCGVSRTGAAAAAVAAQEQATVVLMDFRLPDMSGPAAASLIQAGSPARRSFSTVWMIPRRRCSTPLTPAPPPF